MIPKGKDVLIYALALLVAVYVFGYVLPSWLRVLACKFFTVLDALVPLIDVKPDWVGECSSGSSASPIREGAHQVNAARLCSMHGGVKWTIGGDISNPLVGCHDGSAFDVKTGDALPGITP